MAEALVECINRLQARTGAVKRDYHHLCRERAIFSGGMFWWDRTLGGAQALEVSDLNYKFIFIVYQLSMLLLLQSILFLHVCNEKKNFTSLVLFRITFLCPASSVFVCHNGSLIDAPVWIQRASLNIYQVALQIWVLKYRISFSCTKNSVAQMMGIFFTTYLRFLITLKIKWDNSCEITYHAHKSH